MNSSELMVQIINGIGNGAIYFLIAVGLTVIFGIMNFVNFAHGAFYLFGAYLVYATVQTTGSFWVGLIVGPIVVGVFAFTLERLLLRRTYSFDHAYQIILTLGIALIAGELVIVLWDALPKNVGPPKSLAGLTNLGVTDYPNYRLFVIGFAAVLAIIIWYLLERTRIGAIVRAGTESLGMVSALGINIKLVFTLTFTAGAVLAALGGALAAPMQGLDPTLGDSILGLAFVVVVIGGMGSFLGALVGALVIGVLQSLTIVFWSQGGSVIIYVLMAAVLLARPAGLFGRRTAVTG